MHGWMRECKMLDFSLKIFGLTTSKFNVNDVKLDEHIRGNNSLMIRHICDSHKAIVLFFYINATNFCLKFSKE